MLNHPIKVLIQTGVSCLMTKYPTLGTLSITVITSKLSYEVSYLITNVSI